MIDGEAIAGAVTRPRMRFTRLINQARGFCLEYGIAIRQGAGVFRRDLPRALADEGNDLTPQMRR